MRRISRQLAIFSLLKAISTPIDNPVPTLNVRSRVKPHRNTEQVAVVADQSQAAAIAANVESEPSVDKSHLT
jgi:hypothetical protein